VRRARFAPCLLLAASANTRAGERVYRAAVVSTPVRLAAQNAKRFDRLWRRAGAAYAGHARRCAARSARARLGSQLRASLPRSNRAAF
jgi:hypothetical protein